MTNWINTLPLLAIFAACFIFVSSSRPKIALISIGIIYAGVFVVSAQFSSAWSATIRLIVGFASLLMIFLSANGRVLTFPQIPRSGWLFSLSGFVLFSLVAVFASINAANFLNFPIDLILAGFLTAFCGILVLGISGFPLKVILGILVLYCGFSAIYCSLETSILVNGLLSAINLALGIIGSYFVIREAQEGES
jgi:hypothetical protein